MTSLAFRDAEARWHGAARARRLRLAVGGGAFLLAVLVAAHVGEVDLQRLANGLPMAADYIGRTLPRLRWETLGDDLAAWMWGLDHWLLLLADTLLVAYAGTVLGGAAALLLSFPAAATLAPGWVVGLVRRLLEFMRTVPSLVLALIFVYAFGMGPFAGILALAVPDTGTLAKLLSEALEGADRRQVEAVRAAGAGRMLAVRLGLLPQVVPVMLSQVLYALESNARSATILGVVGAGGIGLALSDRIRINNLGRGRLHRADDPGDGRGDRRPELRHASAPDPSLAARPSPWQVRRARAFHSSARRDHPRIGRSGRSHATARKRVTAFRILAAAAFCARCDPG